jgi:hypothetical protein
MSCNRCDMMACGKWVSLEVAAALNPAVVVQHSHVQPTAAQDMCQHM